MDILRMHEVFRTLGQQMGMQLIRGILPESIDVYINEVINEKSRSLVISNTTTAFNDRISIQDNSISPINYLRTLYKTVPVTDIVKSVDSDFYKVALEIENVMFYTSFNVSYEGGKKGIGTRIIEGDKLYPTLRDYCARASWDDPIVTMFAEDNKEYIELYIDSETKIPNKVDVRIIEHPAIVKYSNIPDDRVNCNLPDYTHNEIVELAVSKFFNSINSTKQSNNRN